MVAEERNAIKRASFRHPCVLKNYFVHTAHQETEKLENDKKAGCSVIFQCSKTWALWLRPLLLSNLARYVIPQELIWMIWTLRARVAPKNFSRNSYRL
jgi:hypothetical protein